MPSPNSAQGCDRVGAVLRRMLCPYNIPLLLTVCCRKAHPFLTHGRRKPFERCNRPNKPWFLVWGKINCLLGIVVPGNTNLQPSWEGGPGKLAACSRFHSPSARENVLKLREIFTGNSAWKWASSSRKTWTRLGELDTKKETLSAVMRIGKWWYFLESLVIGELALGLHGRFEGCLRREPWLAREPGPAEPLWLNRHENILPELKKTGLQKRDGKFGPQSAPAW